MGSLFGSLFRRLLGGDGESRQAHAGRPDVAAVTTPEALRAALVECGLERLCDRIVPLALPSVAVRTEPADEAAIPPGGSKLGGIPDLPPGAEWPQWNGDPLDFLAQIALAEVAPHVPEGLLPADGMLHLFYDQNQSTWGGDPSDLGSWQVRYTPGPLPELTRTAPPRGSGEGYTACAVSYSALLTIPDLQELDELGEGLGVDDGESDAYCDLASELAGGTHLLGHPSPVQGDMHDECQWAANGIRISSPGGYQTPEAQALVAGAADWRLLLQLDSEEDAGMMWGDAGMLYFWIRKQDLEARAFEKTWMILQCY